MFASGTPEDMGAKATAQLIRSIQLRYQIRSDKSILIPELGLTSAAILLTERGGVELGTSLSQCWTDGILLE